MFGTFTESPYKELVKAAVEVKDKAYCPYSNFHVGAAVLTSSNQIFTGIGNASVSSRFSLSFIFICMSSRLQNLYIWRTSSLFILISLFQEEWNGEIILWHRIHKPWLKLICIEFIAISMFRSALPLCNMQHL